MRVPSYCLHRPSGQAYVTLPAPPRRRVVYLGPHGSPESRLRYAEVLSQLEAPGAAQRAAPPTPNPAPVSDDSPFVSEVAALWADRCRTYYRRADGTQTQEVSDHGYSWAVLLRLFRDRRIATLSRRDFVALRDAMIERGWCRKVVVKRYGRVRFGLRLLAEEGLIPLSVPAAASLRPLQPYRSDAPETEPIRPVPLPDVLKTLPHLPPLFAALVRLQLLTGMRPGEVRVLRLRDLVWTESGGVGGGAVGGGYPSATLPLPRLLGLKLGAHKMARFGRPRCIPLSASAAALIGPWAAKAKPGESDLIFPSPAPRAAEGAKPEAVEKREYGKAIERAARRAGVESWGPNRLRHWAATEVRKRLSLDAARSLLGHAEAGVTEVYAEVDGAVAREAAEALEKALRGQ